MNLILTDINRRIEEFEVHPTAPLYGTKVPLAAGVVGELEQKVLDEEGIKLRRF